VFRDECRPDDDDDTMADRRSPDRRSRQSHGSR